MKAAEVILEVAVPSPLHQCFDYRAPADANSNMTAGQRVLVPFGRRRLVGMVLAVKQHSDCDNARLRAAIELLDSAPVLDARVLSLLHWVSAYYQHPIGEVVFTALPVLLRKARAPQPVQARRWVLTTAGQKIDLAGLGRAPRQAAVVTKLRASKHPLGSGELAVSNTVLRSLQDKGLIESVAVSRDNDRTGSMDAASPPALTGAQKTALEQLHSAPSGFQVHLLEGVTGSGKTEVYLRMIQPLLDEGRQVLVLVPEIGLTPQLVSRFERRFDTRVALLHSALNDSQRLSAWQQAASGHARLLIGTRSAVFTPMPALALVIVDEEHDASLKQQDGLRYSARDVAIWRSRQLGIPVILGSATPSLESLYNTGHQRYRHLLLPERAGGATQPKLHLLDIRRQPMDALLSEPLIRRMQQHLENGAQVLVFLNRRGYAPVTLCHDCGWVAECRRCDARMTLHQHSGELRCHHCGSQRRVDRFCPDCGSSELIAVGDGTERVENVLEQRFPGYPVLRIDRDTTRRKGELERALENARGGTAKILLGTQMLAKGHHFPDVTLVALLDVDQGLFSNDFRASERMAQMIVQVAGRAGRADRPGEVIIQTHHPEHPLLHCLVRQGYSGFAAEALQERKEAGLPPFSSLVLLRAEATDKAAPRAFLEDVLQQLQPLTGIDVHVWGPLVAPMEKRAGRYRMQLILQSSRRGKLQKLLKRNLPAVEKLKSARRVRWSVDVDPVDLF